MPTAGNEMMLLPEGDEVGVAEDGAEEGEQEPPHIGVPLHVPPPDLGQQRLEEKTKSDQTHQLLQMNLIIIHFIYKAPFKALKVAVQHIGP